MQLSKAQKKFKDTMLGPADQIEQQDDAFLSLFETYKAPTTERLKIYHNNVVGSLTEALRATFPITEQLVGTNFFKSMARAFIFEHPPEGACLHHYGKGFDSFVKTYAPAQSVPYLADIACLELAQNNAYYACDDLPLTGNAFSKIPAEELPTVTLNLRQSASLISSKYPLLEIRDFCLDEDKTPKPNLDEEHHTKLLIHRQNLEVTFTPLCDDEYLLLKILDEGNSLGKSVEQTVDAYSDFDFPAFLQKHISLETFSALETNKP